MGEFTSTGRELFYKFVQKIGKKMFRGKKKKECPATANNHDNDRPTPSSCNQKET